MSTAEAAAGKLVQTLSGGGQYTGGIAHVTAVIPDGATNVQITYGDGTAPTALAVDNNLIETTVKNPTALEFDAAGQHYSQHLSNLPQ